MTINSTQKIKLYTCISLTSKNMHIPCYINLFFKILILIFCEQLISVEQCRLFEY